MGTVKRSRLRRLTLESLEARTLMATAPLPIVTNQANVSANSTSNNDNNSSPFVAVDPLDPQDLVSVYTDRNTSNGTHLFAQISFSTDGGTTWNSAPDQISPSGDPTSTTGAILNDYAQGVGFDRNHNFFVGVLETNGSNAGEVNVVKYSFATAGVPSRVTSAPVYKWNQAATGENLQASIANFSMAVDDNLASFTDPTTRAVQSDPNSGAVYIAWTTDAPTPPNTNNWNPNSVEVIASTDGVSWPTGGPSGDGAKAITTHFGPERDTSPEIAVSQGKANGVGGQISVVWDDYGSGASASPTPFDIINFASLSFNPGQSQFAQVTGQSEVTTTTVRGPTATVASPVVTYRLGTPSSPIGIGPGAQIAVDNTLGSFSTFQGRIYVTYVDRSTATGNPSDNTDIFLASSDNGGQSWSFPTMVNDDDADVDGHTEANGFNKGRPQYEPSIAVDNSTGSVVMSWLDVRDDPSLDRYANYLTTSIDGGNTFSPQTFADRPNLVTDATTGQAFVAGPYSGNESAGNSANAETTIAFGTHQGLAVADGVIHPVWATTVMDGFRNAKLTIESAQVTLPAGPRVVSGTEGPVSGTSLSSFTITFDRPVAVDTGVTPQGNVQPFTPGQVRVQFLNAVTGKITSNDPTATDFDPNLAIASVVPLDLEFGGLEATQFQVDFKNIQTGVGTYSYAIGPDISDMMRSVSSTGSDGNPMDQNANGVGGEVVDYFANPTPLNPTANPFTGPYDQTTLPIIIAGPHVVSTFVPAGTTDPTGSAQPGGNLMLNGTVSSIDVKFDRPMDPSTLVGGNPVLSITGPTGPIDATNFTVVADPQPGEDPSFPETYKIEFLREGVVNGVPALVPATQSLSGTYSITLGTTAVFPNGSVVPIRAQDGAEVDDNQNAGVGLLFNNQSNANRTVFSAQGGAQDIFLGFGFSGFQNQSTITVPSQDNNRIQDFGLTLNFSNPTGDPVTATLTLPGNKTITLFTGITTTGLNNVTFSDSATTTLANGETTGTFKPSQSFLGNGQLLNALESGNYTLTLSSPTSSNPNNFDIGTLNSLSIAITTPVQVQSQVGAPTTFVAQVPAGGGAIGTAAPLVSTITVPAGDNGLIQDFSLGLNVTYPNDPDLTATLSFTPLNGTPLPAVLLFSGNGNVSGSKANFNSTVFNDGATTLIQNGAPPFFGAFKPLQSFLVNGQLAGAGEAGTYTLTITDNAPAGGASTGTLNGWSITITPKVTTNTGLGEAVADRTTASFRIFTMDPTNPLSSNTWTAVGPASVANGGNSGRVSAIAVDTSDPSGNTVYVAGASGGVWKTTDFLTTTGQPTYVPLTGDGGANTLNIGSIAVFARNGDPNQSIIVAGTGEGNTASPGVQGSSTVNTSEGVGFLISYNGGKTWTLDDSLVNYDANGNELPMAQRKHEFVGTSTFKVIIDPTPVPGTNGDIAIYAALGGGQNGLTGQGGIYRSLDSGHTWKLMQAGFATDVVFDPDSGAPNALGQPVGNLQILYGAFEGDGVRISTNQGQSWPLMAGGVGDPLLQNQGATGRAAPVPVTAPGSTPNGVQGRIVLAKPALTGNALLDAENRTWLYAAVVTPGGAFQGLYLTKDNGANWTDVRLPNASPATATAAQGLDPSNNIGDVNYNITGGQGGYDFALAVDPNNPNITYIGGSADFGPTTMIRVDVTRLADPYSDYASTETAGGQSLENTTSPVTIKDPKNLILSGLNPLTDPFTNLYRNPNDIFQQGAAVTVTDTGSFANDGSGAWYTPFAGFIGGTDVHTIVPIVDPVTGKTRLLVGYDQGIATGVDDGTGQLLTSVGNRSLPTGPVNGDLQITQFYNGAAQPGALAAQVAGALFYGEAQDDGFPKSNADVLTSGNIGWFGPTGDGTDVATDQTGSGTSYQSTWPCCNELTNDSPNEFFQVSPNGGSPIGRTFGLIQSTSVPTGVGLAASSDPQWPLGPSFNFAVNPVDPNAIMIGSAVGRLFSTDDQGLNWHDVGSPTTPPADAGNLDKSVGNFDGSTIPALAYGAPDPGATGINGDLDNYMLIGTSGGHIYATFTGGGGGPGGGLDWTPLSAGLDGSGVQRIVTDPTRGTHDAYAITTSGVFYNADTAAANSAWVNITGNLFSLQTTPFGDSALTGQQLKLLSGLAVDWRYVVPFSSTNPALGTHPMLYVGGLGGVFRSEDNGTTWSAFPDQTLNTPVPLGNLPNSSVTDLDMVLGNVDPTTGHPDVSTGPNLLLATTYGTGSYGIRLAPIVFNNAISMVAATPGASGQLTFSGLSEQSAFGNAVTVTIQDVTDPAHPISLGAGQTDADGRFSVTGSYPTAPPGNPFAFGGTRSIAVFAADASGTKGNVVTFTTTNPLPTPVAPVLQGGLVVGSTDITASTNPSFQVAVPGGVTATVGLLRIDGLGNTTTVATASITGAGTIQDPGPVAPGAYKYEVDYVVTIDGQPSTSPASPATAVQVVAPLGAPALDPADDSGTKGDGVTDVAQPRFFGVAVPNTANDSGLVLDLVAVAAPAGSGLAPNAILATVADPGMFANPSNGQYLIQPSKPLADGVYTLLVQVRDPAGDVIQSSQLTLTIDTAPPQMVPTLNLLAGEQFPASEQFPAGETQTIDHQLTVYGQTDPGATVGIYDGHLDLVGIATAQPFALNGHPKGYYQAQIQANIYDGTLQLYAFAHSVAGVGGPQFGSLAVGVTTVEGDYNGDGKADLAVYTPSIGDYAYGNSGTAVTTFIANYGIPNVDIPVAGDYDGDGRTDPALYRPTTGQWIISGSRQGAITLPPILTPAPNVVPVPGEFDADGQVVPAVYVTYSTYGYPAGTWVIEHNVVTPTSTSSTQVVAWGIAGDVPVAGDYEGVGAAQVAVYRPSTGAWYIRNTATGKQDPAVNFPNFTPEPGDVPVPGDYDGLYNGVYQRTEEAIFRPSTEQCFIYDSAANTTRMVQMPTLTSQGTGDVIIPAPAAYSGDGKTDPAIFDQTIGTFEYFNSEAGRFSTQAFAITYQDIPLPAPIQYRIAAHVTATPAFAPQASPAFEVAPAVTLGAVTPAGSIGAAKGAAPAASVSRSVSPSFVVMPAPRPSPPPQDLTDAAIGSLGKSYRGFFI